MVETLPFPLEDRYYRFGYYLKQRFGKRIYKVSLHAGFTCPNRDGTKGRGGCIYCNNASFVPAYARENHTITEQIEAGIRILKKRYKPEGFLAYFQSYTNTYGSVEHLGALYREALDHPEVVGLLIGTRADCLTAEVWALLEELARERFVSLELGIESVYNRSLDWMHRGHYFADVIRAVRRGRDSGLFITGHIILGFPVETRLEMLNCAPILNQLGLHSLKIHHLQVVKGTELERIYRREHFPVWDAEEYVEFVSSFLERLDPNLVIQRLVGEVQGDLLVAPLWRVSKAEVIQKIRNCLKERGSYQGRLYATSDNLTEE